MASLGRTNDISTSFYLQAVRLARRVRLQELRHSFGGGGSRGEKDDSSDDVKSEEGSDIEEEKSSGRDEESQERDIGVDFEYEALDCCTGRQSCTKEEMLLSNSDRDRKTRVHSDHGIAFLTNSMVAASEGYVKRGPVDKRGFVSTLTMLSGREINLSKRGKWSRAECCHVAAKYLPVDDPRVVDQMGSRVYVGRFSADGSLFVGGFQERHVRVYNVDSGWTIRKDILARQLRWTVTDTALSSDQRFLIYATISPIVHLVSIGSESGVESLANITELHEGLDFSMDRSGQHSLGLYSVQFSQDGREIVAGSNRNAIYVYDLVANKPILCLEAHKDDVNAVTYADETCHLIYSGSDDHTCKVWDRRCLMSRSRPAGVLIGHLEGITFIDSRGDGRYFISNGKDQTTKLWDIRKMSNSISASKLRSKKIPSYSWDYRWMDYPGLGRDIKHPYDQSIMTYKGHRVLRTLIRCYFSPAFSTGQKYIYTGSHDGCVYIYDLVSGECVAQLKGFHRSAVRDCSWHPFSPMLVSSSWEGSIVQWRHLHGDSDGQISPVCQQREPFFDSYYDLDND